MPLSAAPAQICFRVTLKTGCRVAAVLAAVLLSFASSALGGAIPLVGQPLTQCPFSLYVQRFKFGVVFPHKTGCRFAHLQQNALRQDVRGVRCTALSDMRG